MTLFRPQNGSETARFFENWQFHSKSLCKIPNKIYNRQVAIHGSISRALSGEKKNLHYYSMANRILREGKHCFFSTFWLFCPQTHGEGSFSHYSAESQKNSGEQRLETVPKFKNSQNSAYNPFLFIPKGIKMTFRNIDFAFSRAKIFPKKSRFLKSELFSFPTIPV